MRRIQRRAAGFFFCCLVLLQLPSAGTLGAEELVKIGVLATRGSEQCLKSWGPTADHLSRLIPGKTFVIVPLSHEQIAPNVKQAKVDFLLTNSSFYVELEQQYGINRIVTLKEMRLGRAYSKYGSVIFSRLSRNDVRTLADLKRKSFMGVSEDSLGGWRMAWREFKENGIDPYRDFKSLHFADTHDSVVEAVRDGRVDAGTVRTNTLEELSAEGKINLEDFYVFPRLHDVDQKTPYLCTTREYPDWPMAKMKGTPDDLAEKVAVALLQMPADSSAALAAGCAGWTIPLNYQPVTELMMELRLGIYKDLGKVTLTDILLNYGPWILLAFIFFCSHLTFTFLVVKLNRKIKASHLSLMEEIEMHKKLDRELEEAKQLAEAATLAKSRFLANMSHEIRTPMNGIIAATDLALAESLTPEVEHYLHIVHNSSYALLGIINDILDFSKIEAGQLELKERAFRLDEMFDRVIDVFVSQAAAKDIELLVDVDAGTPRLLHGDSLRLQQILTNLIGNAIKFTGAGGMILISVRESESTQGRIGNQIFLDFAVKDTGAGIAPEYLPLLFEPFTQGDSSSTRKYEGTGLGLSICKKFVTMMHGDIGVETEIGKGSTFFFSVQLKKAGDQLVSRLIFPPDISKLHVLVVDDSRDSREIMEKMLSSLGFTVEALPSGTEAIIRLQKKDDESPPVELILMDWKMAQMDGIEASRRIREELHLTLPIIMMTAFAKEVHKSTAEKVGINGFLTKPIFQSTLFDAIMDAFGKAGLQKSGVKIPFTTKASMYKKQLRGCKILVADDNLTNQEVAKAILEGAGIVVTVVGNGEEAVAKVVRESFDAVLMDIQMPRINGFQATQQIRMIPGGEKLPIIAMTAHALKGDEERCLEAGMDGYVSKPINQERLFYTLWHHLLHRKQPAEAIDGDEVANGPESAVSPQAEDVHEREAEAFASHLPGIDIGAVLQATGLTWTTFQDILDGFYRDNQGTIAALQQALGAGDLSTLQHLAHSLKGSAGNIGAGELREAASELEQGCSNDLTTAELSSLCRELEEELTRLLAVLPPKQKTSAIAEKELAPIAVEDIIELLQALTEAIDRADPEEIDRLTARLLQQCAGQEILDETSLAALAKETERYDYDQALRSIESMVREIKEGR